jgi:hypothetical protein
MSFIPMEAQVIVAVSCVPLVGQVTYVGPDAVHPGAITPLPPVPPEEVVPPVAPAAPPAPAFPLLAAVPAVPPDVPLPAVPPLLVDSPA